MKIYERAAYFKNDLFNLFYHYLQIMSDSQEGEVDVQGEEEWDQDNNKNSKIKKKKTKPKKYKKQGKIGQFISSTYRRQRCQYFNRGNCVKGDMCTYSHDFQPDTAKKICKFYLGGTCSKGFQCQYSHNTSLYPCKFFHIQYRCNLGPNCRFSHGAIPSDFYHEYMKDNKDFILKLYRQGRLQNKNYLQFIESDIPKNQTNSLPMPIVSNPNLVVKTQNKTVWTNALKKDPRQRIKPKTQEPIILSPAKERIIIKQQQQKKIEVKQESIEQKFMKKLNCYFYSYY